MKRYEPTSTEDIKGLAAFNLSNPDQYHEPEAQEFREEAINDILIALTLTESDRQNELLIMTLALQTLTKYGEEILSPLAAQWAVRGWLIAAGLIQSAGGEELAEAVRRANDIYQLGIEI